MIDFARVDFSYGAREVFRGLSFHIDRGARRALMGPSGRGKTTLLRLTMGLERPEAGKVTVNTDRISPLFQEDRLLPFLTVYENCALFCPDGDRVGEMLSALGLSEAAGALPSALSGGMARRAALARCLCHKAELYLLDEPFTGLDGDNARRAADLVNRVTRGKTLLVVTHSPGEAGWLDCEPMELGV